MRLSLGMSSNSDIYINNNNINLMELEKTLFRVHERVLSGKYIFSLLRIVIIIFSAISVYTLINFVILNAS